MDFWRRYFLAVAVVALVLGGLGVLGRVVRGGRILPGARRLELLESIALGSQSTLHLVRCYRYRSAPIRT